MRPRGRKSSTPCEDAMATCTACSAPLPPSETVCAYCGTRNNVDLTGIHEYTVAAPRSGRTCPRCAVELQTINVLSEGTFLIEQCPDCFGLFFDPGELEALLQSSVDHVYEIDLKRLESLTQTSGQQPVRYVKCPVCGVFMNRVNFGTRSGVVADRCRDHGVWLDGGELRQLLEWRKAGGQLLHEQAQAERKKEEEKQHLGCAALGKVLTQQDGWSARGWGAQDDDPGTDSHLLRLLCGFAGRPSR